MAKSLIVPITFTGISGFWNGGKTSKPWRSSRRLRVTVAASLPILVTNPRPVIKTLGMRAECSGCGHPDKGECTGPGNEVRAVRARRSTREQPP